MISFSFSASTYVQTRRRRIPDTPDTRILCPNCPRTFKYSNLLTYHQKHECGRDLKCHSCQRQFGLLVQLAEHKKYGCYSEFMCLSCNYRAKNVSTIRSHCSRCMQTSGPNAKVGWTVVKEKNT